MAGKKKMKTVWKVLLCLVGVWALLLVAVQVALSPRVLTRLADRLAAEYVDADVDFGEVRLSVFRSFPYLNVGFRDFSLTYPSGRFESQEDSSYYMMRQGRGPGADTLASIRGLHVSVDLSALMGGTVKLPSLVLDKPRIFAKNYADGSANWNIFRLPVAKEKDDSTASEPLEFALGRIVLRGRPHIVYSSPADTLFAMLDFERMRFNGRLAAEDWTNAVRRMQVIDTGRRGLIADSGSIRPVDTGRIRAADSGNVRSAGSIPASSPGLRNDHGDSATAASKGYGHDGDAAAGNGRRPEFAASGTSAAPGLRNSHDGNAIPGSEENSHAGSATPDSRREARKAEAAERRIRNGNRRDSLRKVRRARRNRVGVRVDSLLFAGRLPSDTLALKLDMLGAQMHHRHVDLDVRATAWMGTVNYGRIALPVDFRAEVGIRKDSAATAIDILDCRARIAGIPLEASATVGLGDRLYLNGSASIDACRVGDVLGHFRRNLPKPLENIETDAEITLTATFDGYLNLSGGEIPDFDARLVIPRSTLGNRLFDLKHELALDTELHGSSGVIDVKLNEFHVKGKALHLDVSGSVADILGGDPALYVDAGLEVSLDTLSRYLKRRSGIEMAGGLSASVSGSASLSQLDPYQLAQADISAKVKSTRLKVVSEKDSLRFWTDSLDLWLGAVGNTRDSSVAQGERMLALTASLDSTFFSLKDDMRLIGRDISLKAQNSAAVLDKSDSSSFYPFGGRLDIGFASLVGSDTSFVALSNSANIFKISPKSGSPDVPVLTLDSSSGRVIMRGPVNRIFVRNLDLDATAAMNSIERRRRARAFVDSLARRNPGVPMDSLFGRFRRTRGSRPVPEWLSEEDFRERDIRIDLGETFRGHMRDWDFDGSMSIGSAGVVSPYFPLRNRLSDVRASFNNNELRFDSFRLASGTSGLSASGRLGGLRSALAGRGMLRLDMDLDAERLNLNELLAAWELGSRFEPEGLSDASLEIEDEEYQEMVVVDTLADSAEPDVSTLIVVPGNLVADLRLKASDVSYAKLKIDSMTADIAVRERCVQLTNTSLSSDIGDIGFEGFYSTRTKQDLKTGFDLELKDITAEKVIEMMPAVDSVMSMLKSFRGRLNCVVSATADLDTAMNIMTPSINGVIRISGEDLTLSESTAFEQIARKLMFKDRTGGHIDRMSVEGMISDNKIEVFPFVLKVDRYTLAMSGVQNLDASFKYHVSVIDSPLPFRVGIDLSGTFDDFKFRIGKPKYKSAAVPVFSEVIDDTRINLRESIQDIFRRGVDNAIRENRRNRFIEERRRELGYKSAVDQKLDSLSPEEKAVLEAGTEPAADSASVVEIGEHEGPGVEGQLNPVRQSGLELLPVP